MTLKQICKFGWLALALALCACNNPPAKPGMKLGKPYNIGGKTYYPEYDPTYDKIGMASWYGPGFHGKYTASGEVFNQNDLTAAHPTLPMPSLVRVTNLETGKSLIVRINDRGPFKSNRIIDLSKGSAKQLGILSTTQVRVQFLGKETDEYLASFQNGGHGTDMASFNDDARDTKAASIASATEPESDPQPDGQIVESSDANTHAGQVVSEAAPIMSVDSGELNQAKSSPALGRHKWVEPQDEPAAAPAKSGGSKPVVLKEQVEADNTEEAQPEPVKAEPVKAKAIKAAPAAGGSYYIQAGSFASEENANNLSSQLSSAGEVNVGEITVGDKSWWRVRVGPFANEADAGDALEKARSSGAPDARLVH
jgi:rare lipoprotein A